MTDEKTLAAWERALRRGQLKTGPEVEAEALAEAYPERSPQQLCAEAGRVSVREGDMRVTREHFDAAAEVLEAEDDRVRAEEAEPSADGGAVEPQALADVQERLDELEETVETLTRLADRDVPLLKAAFGSLAAGQVDEVEDLPGAMEELRETVDELDEEVPES